MDKIDAPSYTRDEISVGIAHFGVGNFHRAHQAVYLHELFERGLARDWGICGIGILPGDSRMRDALAEEHFRYTHIERRPDGTSSARTIASIVDYLFAPDDPEAVLALLSRPSTRIVSLTITEGGYNTRSVTGAFDASTPAIVADLEPGAVPSTVFGFIVEALSRRREAGVPAFTVMSCDNLQGNGEVARKAVTAFAHLRDPELARWIEAEVQFPNSMVDRITPATSDQDRQFAIDQFGATDPWPVLSEAYLQWVVEDRFAAGRPPFEMVGVDVVGDVVPYERMKLRLLNASHQALAYFGLLMGFQFVDEAAGDPLIGRLLERYLTEEAEPTLETIPGYDVTGYGRMAIERFTNASIRDTLARIATDASDRISTFLVPVALDGSRDGRATPMTAAVIASWAHLALSRPPHISDRQQAVVDDALAAQASRPAGFLQETRFFGDIAESPAFVADFTSAYQRIDDLGVRDALALVVEQR